MNDQTSNFPIIIFISLILPIFTGNYPEVDISQIFDLFLLRGQQSVIEFLVRILIIKKDKILELKDADLH